MNKTFKFLSVGLIAATFASGANAEMLYTTQAGKSSRDASVQSHPFASEKPFYIGAAYNFTVWEKTIDRPLLLSLGGNNDNTFDVMAGVRVFDWLRTEVNYYKTKFELAGDRVVLNGNTVFLNAIVDARLNSLFRTMHKQWFVPYVGVGLGVSFNTLDCDVPQLNAQMDRESPMVWNAMAGVAIEVGDTFTFDIGYRYMYMMAPHVSLRVSTLDYELDDMSPTAHQFRFGVRVNF